MWALENVLPPACSGVLAGHDHMDIGVLLIPDPIPGLLRSASMWALENVLPPACSGVLAGHDHMDIGVLLIPDPIHPGDLRTVVRSVAVA